MQYNKLFSTAIINLKYVVFNILVVFISYILQNYCYFEFLYDILRSYLPVHTSSKHFKNIESRVVHYFIGSTI